MYPQQGVVAPSGVTPEISAETAPSTPVLGAAAVNPVGESQSELETQGVVAPTVPAPSHSQCNESVGRGDSTGVVAPSRPNRKSNRQRYMSPVATRVSTTRSGRESKAPRRMNL